MKLDINAEIIFKTARSGGKGGQNVNKVETMVDGRWHIENSVIIDGAQKQLLLTKLVNKLSKEGYIIVKSQEARTQLMNKQIVVNKFHDLIHKALIKKKLRLPTKTPKSVLAKRKESKSKTAIIKETRKKINLKDL